jgi:hypothetical protein
MRERVIQQCNRMLKYNTEDRKVGLRHVFKTETFWKTVASLGYREVSQVVKR